MAAAAVAADMAKLELIARERVQVGGSIATGAAKEVFHAILDGKLQVVKCVLEKGKICDDAKVRAAFRQELAVLGSLHDVPGVMLVLGILESGRQGRPEEELAFIAEHCSRGTIKDLLADVKNSELTEGRRAGLAIQLCTVVVALHRRQPALIHKDLKPQNVLVCSDWTVRVADFGLAELARTMTVAGGGGRSVVAGATAASGGVGGGGTYGYMAAEQMATGKRGERPVPITTAADVYSLGCTLLELFTGRAPFSDLPNGAAVVVAVSRGETPIDELDQLTIPALRSAIESCLQLDPARRPTAADLLRQLQTIFPNQEELIRLEMLVEELRKQAAQQAAAAAQQTASAVQQAVACESAKAVAHTLLAVHAAREQARIEAQKESRELVRATKQQAERDAKQVAVAARQQAEASTKQAVLAAQQAAQQDAAKAFTQANLAMQSAREQARADSQHEVKQLAEVVARLRVQLTAGPQHV